MDISFLEDVAGDSMSLCSPVVMGSNLQEKALKHDGTQLYLKGYEPDYPVGKTIRAFGKDGTCIWKRHWRLQGNKQD